MNASFSTGAREMYHPMRTNYPFNQKSYCRWVMGTGCPGDDAPAFDANPSRHLPTCRWAMGLALTSAWGGALFASCKSRANLKKNAGLSRQSSHANTRDT